MVFFWGGSCFYARKIQHRGFIEACDGELNRCGPPWGRVWRVHLERAKTAYAHVHRVCADSGLNSMSQLHMRMCADTACVQTRHVCKTGRPSRSFSN